MKIIAIDLDGTLIDNKHEIPQNTIDFLNNLIKSGIKLVITSGRPYRSMLKYALNFPDDTMLVSENGAYISNINKSIYKELKRFNKKTFLSLFTDNKPIIKNAFFSIGHYAFIYNRIPKLEPLYHIDENTVVVNGPYDLIDNFQAPNGAIFIIKSDERHKFEEYIDNTKKISYRSLGYDANNAVYEISISTIDKSIALSKILKIYGLSWDDLMVIGDGINDLESIKKAGIGVAMANAEIDVRNAAKYITSKNNNDEGVYNFLNEYLKK